MCVSIEPCRMQQASSAVLAQSTECMMHTIGRKPDSQGSEACPDMHGGQPGCKQQASSGVFALTCTAKRGNIENRRSL